MQRVLVLQSPPLRAAKALGLFDEIVRAGRPQPYLAMARADGGLIAEVPQVNVNEPGDPPFVSMSRTALHDVLVRAVRRHGVEVRLGITADPKAAELTAAAFAKLAEPI